VLVKEHGDAFPRKQSCYDVVVNLLDKLLRLIQPYITQGLEGEELAPEYLLDAAGNVVDIIVSDLGNTSSTSAAEAFNVMQITKRQMTIERAVQMIDRTMIIIFQVSKAVILAAVETIEVFNCTAGLRP